MAYVPLAGLPCLASVGKDDPSLIGLTCQGEKETQRKSGEGVKGRVVGRGHWERSPEWYAN